MAGFSGKTKVDEQELEKTAEEAKKKIAVYRSRISDMDSLIQNTASYWEGEGGGHYRTIFKTQKKEVDTMLSVYKKYADQLLEHSGKVKSTRSEAQSKAEALNGVEMC